MSYSLFNWRQAYAALSAFRAYPILVTPGLLISSLTNQTPVYLIAIFFSSKDVGFYALANTVVLIPLSILINSVTSVFLQKAADAIRTAEHRLPAMITELYNTLMLISALGAVSFMVVAHWLFSTVFGPQWVQAGNYAMILAASSIFQAVAIPLNVLFRLKHREKLNFKLNVIFLLIRGIVLVLCVLTLDRFLYIILAIGALNLLSSFFYLFFVFPIANVTRGRLYRDLFLIVFVLVIFFLNDYSGKNL